VRQERRHQSPQTDDKGEKHKDIIGPRHLAAAQNLIRIAPEKHLLALLRRAAVENGIESRGRIILRFCAIDAAQPHRHGDTASQQEHGGERVERPGDDAVEAVDEEGGDADDAGDESECAGEGAVVCCGGDAAEALRFGALAFGEADGKAEDDGAEDELSKGVS
jgi:hypothetical protein